VPVNKPNTELPAELEENKLRYNFEQLDWFHKIDERIDQQHLLECVSTITNFYSEQAAEGEVLAKQQQR